MKIKSIQIRKNCTLKGEVYDVYVDGKWTITRSHPDNVFAWLNRFSESNGPLSISYEEDPELDLSVSARERLRSLRRHALLAVRNTAAAGVPAEQMPDMAASDLIEHGLLAPDLSEPLLPNLIAILQPLYEKYVDQNDTLRLGIAQTLFDLGYQTESTED